MHLLHRAVLVCLDPLRALLSQRMTIALIIMLLEMTSTVEQNRACQ